MRSLLEMSLRPSPMAAAEARKGLRSIAGALPAGRFDDVRLLASELVTNSVRHAVRPGEPQGSISFSVRLTDDCLRVEVRDSGRGFEKRVRPFTDDQESGWGLQIVDRLSYQWGVIRGEGDGSTVWVEMDI